VGDEIAGVVAGTIASVRQKEQRRSEDPGDVAGVGKPRLAGARLESRETGQGDARTRRERGQCDPGSESRGS
jgi:hypothetical protein